MTASIYIEHPPPFRWARQNPAAFPFSVSVRQGLEVVAYYLRHHVPIRGFHHADLDPYEVRGGGEMPPARCDTFDYVRSVRGALDGWPGLLLPHRLVVYRTPEAQAPEFLQLLKAGIDNVILVGRPHSRHPTGRVYHTSVEQMLTFLSRALPDLKLGVIGIHGREGEAERILRKYRAAAGRLRVMGQFVDAIQPLEFFFKQLVEAGEKLGISLDGLEWNVGLAIFSLQNRGFYARLLRQESLACEARFKGLQSLDQRLELSLRMDLEFAERAWELARRYGLNLGFSVQPIIERTQSGALHPALDVAIELCYKLAEFDTVRRADTLPT